MVMMMTMIEKKKQETVEMVQTSNLHEIHIEEMR